MRAIWRCPSPARWATADRPAASKSRSTQENPVASRGRPMSTAGWRCWRRMGSRGSSASTSIMITASTMEPAATRSIPSWSSWVSSRTSCLNDCARVTTPVTNCMITPTLTSTRSGAMRARTWVRCEASARAPACGPVVELADGALDAGAGLGGDRSLAGERVGHGRHGDPRHARHVVDRRHLVIPSSTPAGATLASRSAVETAVVSPPSWTAFTLPFNVIPASKRFDEGTGPLTHDAKAPR